MNKIELLGLAFVGGIIPDILRIVAVRDKGIPKYLFTWFFWISTILLGLVGAFTCFLLSPTGMTEAFALGYSAPSILSRIGGEAAKSGKGSGGSGGKSKKGEQDRGADQDRNIDVTRQDESGQTDTRQDDPQRMGIFQWWAV